MSDTEETIPTPQDEQGLAPRPVNRSHTRYPRWTWVVAGLVLVGIGFQLLRAFNARSEQRTKRHINRPTAPAVTPDQLAFDAERKAQQERRQDALAQAAREEERARRRLLLERAVNDFMKSQAQGTGPSRQRLNLSKPTKRSYGPLRPRGLTGGATGSGHQADRSPAHPPPAIQEAFLDALRDFSGGTARIPQTPPPQATPSSPAYAPTIARFHHASEGWVLPAGTAIPVTLETHVTTAGPGPVIGIVNHDVYAVRPRRARVIPRGARLLGTLVAEASFGDARIYVAWDRVQYPDGGTLLLDEPYTTDGEGAGGAHDRVNNHWGALYGHALLTSLVSASAQLSQPQSSSAFDTRSAGQEAAASVGQELANVTNRVADRNLSRRPVLELRAGTRLHVTLREDLAFPLPSR